MLPCRDFALISHFLLLGALIQRPWVQFMAPHPIRLLYFLGPSFSFTKKIIWEKKKIFFFGCPSCQVTSAMKTPLTWSVSISCPVSCFVPCFDKTGRSPSPLFLVPSRISPKLGGFSCPVLETSVPWFDESGVSVPCSRDFRPLLRQNWGLSVPCLRDFTQAAL